MNREYGWTDESDTTDKKNESGATDKRFICPKCNSTNVVMRPYFGCIMRCKDCNHKWQGV